MAHFRMIYIYIVLLDHFNIAAGAVAVHCNYFIYSWCDKSVIKHHYLFTIVDLYFLLIMWLVKLLIKCSLGVKKYNIFMKNLVEWKYKVAENGNTQVKYKLRRIIFTVQHLSKLYLTFCHWLFKILTKLFKYVFSVDMIACNQFGYYTGPSQALLWFVSSSLVLWLFELASVSCFVAKLWRIGCAECCGLQCSSASEECWYNQNQHLRLSVYIVWGD